MNLAAEMCRSTRTQGSTIALNVLVMNLEKLLELLFVLFAYWLQLLLGNEPGMCSRFAHLSNQVAPA
jgi:IS5 family transposase